ncbi:benzodiazapine receptor [Exophiala viscosa]|uniref:Benzodiazapine receptor n=1 Tax=Exophiala viscosa TaxID=2486360 RepID=A0AAN6DVT3_9EURO|nr:benzodiazapine receptor [Exophiala viscosa]
MAYVPGLTLPSSIFSNAPVSILLPLGLGLGSGLVSQPGRLKPKNFSDERAKERGKFRSTQEQYVALKQPPFRPPPWVFAPAWSTLYLMMGYAAHRAWTTGMASLNPQTVEHTRRGATLYTLQLGLNIIWMPLFFGLGRPIEAMLDIVTLTGTVGYLMYIWQKVDPVAAYLMAPYLAWLGFATYLTAGTGYLNGWTMKSTEQSDERAELKKDS